MTSVRPSHPGVRFPPPLLYAAGLGAGWLFQRWHPLPMTWGSSRVRIAVAAACIALWLALFLGAFTSFQRARTTIIPNKPAVALVTTGLYRFTRNPMYLSLVALYLGLTLLLESWWPILLLPAVIFTVDRLVIAREERYLSAAFPSEYAAYRERVRRWL